MSGSSPDERPPEKERNITTARSNPIPEGLRSLSSKVHRYGKHLVFWAKKTLPPQIRNAKQRFSSAWNGRTRSRILFGCLGICAIAIFTGPFLWALLLHGFHLADESWNTPTADYLEEIAQLDSEKFYTNVRNLGLIALGIIGMALAVWRSVLAHQAHKLSEKGLIIDRFQKGAQMLESGELSVRFAGIYALRELARSDPDDAYIMVLDVLVDFVRERSKERKPRFDKVTKDRFLPDYGPFPPDLQKALETMSWIRNNIPRATSREQQHKWFPDMREANLANAIFGALNFSKMKLTHANLNFMRFDHTDISEAFIESSSTYKSNFSEVNFENGRLDHTPFIQSQISNANVSGTLFLAVEGKGAIFHDLWFWEGRPPEGPDEVATAATARYQGEDRMDFRKRQGALRRERQSKRAKRKHQPTSPSDPNRARSRTSSD